MCHNLFDSLEEFADMYEINLDDLVQRLVKISCLKYWWVLQNHNTEIVSIFIFLDNGASIENDVFHVKIYINK